MVGDVIIPFSPVRVSPPPPPHSVESKSAKKFVSQYLIHFKVYLPEQAVKQNDSGLKLDINAEIRKEV